jgi:hypothetical protein
MNFFPHTSIEIPKQTNGLIAKDALSSFWNFIDDELEEGLSGAIGCYIFSIRAGKGALPWYVGLAEKQSFRKECFTTHKLYHYNDAIADRKGTPMLTLIAKYTPGGKLVHPTENEHPDIQFLEKMLISKCLTRNPYLRNVKDTKLLRDMVVYGLLNTPQGNPKSSVSEFRSLIGG